MTDVETIRTRWADCTWPNIGYFVHGQARLDIAELLSEIDRLERIEKAGQALWDAHVKSHGEKPAPQKYGMNYGELVALGRALRGEAEEGEKI